MDKPGNNKPIYFTIVSFLVLLVPTFYFAYQIYCFIVYTNHSDALANFESALPNIIRTVGYYDVIFVTLAIIALLLAAKGISTLNSFWHNLSLIITFFSGLLAFNFLLLMILKLIF